MIIPTQSIIMTIVMGGLLGPLETCNSVNVVSQRTSFRASKREALCFSSPSFY